MSTDLYNFVGAWPNNLGVPPIGDPATFGVQAVFSLANDKQFVDFKDQKITGRINNIQAVYIDNDNDAKITLIVEGGSFQRIIAKARTQGWYPIAMADEMNISLQSTAIIAAPAAVNFLFSNVLVTFGPYQTQ
jgi:hypothetical protein